MEEPISLLDVLRVLPLEARENIFGTTLSPAFAGARLACQQLKQTHDDTITHLQLKLSEGNALDAIHLREPLLAKFGRCNSVTIQLGQGDGGHLVSLAFAGVSAAIRCRITRLEVRSKSRSIDALHVVQSCAPLLPSLEELHLAFSELSARYGDAHQHILAYLLATFLPQLRCLTIPTMSGDELPGIGALAACPRLRELTITCAESLKLTDDMVEGLSRLQHLQSLSLVCRWLGGFPALTQVLLGARRPPHVRTISVKIPIQYHTFSFQLEYGRLSAPGAAASVTAAAAGAGGPVEGILRVTVCKGSRGHMLMAPMESMAELVLGAAAELRQRRIPELVIQELDTGSWEPPEMVEPGEPLSRLLARCSRVDLGSFKVYSSQTPWVAAATARLFGLPRELSLCHHLWGCSADTLAMLAVEPRQRVQEQQQQQQVQPTLLFDPLNPRELQEVAKQVIQDAAAQLWTQAAGSIGAIVGRHGSGSGTAIVLLRGPLPGSPHFEAEDREWERWLRDTLCQWFGGPQPQPPQPPQPQGAQRQQQGQAAQELGKRSWDTRDRQPDDVPDAAASPAAADRAARGLPVAAGAAGGPDDAVAAVAAAVAAGAAVAPPQLQEFGVLLGSCAVAAPTAGIVLVECWTRAHAAELVELLGETTAAHGGGGGGGGAPVRAAVLPVGLPGVTAEVQEVWESAVIKAILATVRRSAPTPAHAEAAAAYGTNANAAANAVLPAAAAAAVRGGAALEEAPARIDGALLGRLDALVRLDIAVRGLWQDMQCWNLRGLDSEREEAEEAEELEEEEGGMEALLGLEEDAAEEWAEEWAEAEEEEEQEAEEGQEEVGNEVLRLEEDVEMGVGQGFGG